MAFDYEAVADEAFELIEEFGRTATFIQFAQAPADPAQPWRGATDPRASVVQSHSLPCVAVDVGTVKKMGMSALPEDLLKRVSKFLVVGVESTFAGDLLKVHEVLDETIRYSVLAAEALRPASTNVLYFVAVAR